MFALNLLLAWIWTLLTGQFRPGSFLFGFALGYLCLGPVTRVSGATTYFAKPLKVVGFVWFFLRALIRANLRVAYEVMTPSLKLRPAIIAVPLDVESDAAIALLANLITLTPGGFSLEISADRRVLYVHTMYMHDAEAFRREIKDGFERRVLELLR